MLALKYVGDEFLDRVRYYNDVWWPARELVQMAHTDRFQVSFIVCCLVFVLYLSTVQVTQVCVRK